MRHLLFLLLFLFTISSQSAEKCDDCTPLAEVAVTNAGLEKLISLSLDGNLKALEGQVNKRAGFRDFKLDHSMCRGQTILEAWENKKKGDDCYGLPNIDETGLVGGETRLRPFVAELKNFKLNKADFELAAPVKCHNFVCDFEIKAKNIDISSDLSVTYTDKGEAFIPPTPITLKTTENSDIRMKGQVLIEPKSAHVNDLAFLKEDQSKIQIAPGSLTLDMPIKTEYASKEEEMRIKARNFHRYVPVKKIDDKYIDQQYESTRMRLEMDAEKEIAARQKSEGKTIQSWQAQRAQAAKEVDQMIQDKYGSIAQFKQKLRDIKWPSPDDDKATYEFIQNPPAEVVVFQDIKDKMDFANIAAIGENSGFSNPYAFAFTVIAVEVGKKAGESSYITNQFIQPMLEKEVLPVVHAQVNAELNNLKKYWNQISKIPNLKMQDLQVLRDLQDSLAKSQDPKEKERLRQKIKTLEHKMDSDWISIDTEVAIDQNTRDGQLLKAQITKSNPACSTRPKRFSDDTETDFDMRTNFGVNTLQEYFNRMASNKNLDLCVDSTKPNTCSDGTKINLKRPPKISCSNGEYAFDFDAEAASKIMGIPTNSDIDGRIKARINNCSGSPCIQMTDAKGRFKNVFLNTFFGSMLDRGMSTAMTHTNNIPFKIPHTNLKKSQTSNKDCNTKLDWTIEP